VVSYQIRLRSLYILSLYLYEVKKQHQFVMITNWCSRLWSLDCRSVCWFPIICTKEKCTCI